jgi:Xaa-Pro dipeptidase
VDFTALTISPALEAPVWGYHSELERTMIIGPASDEQRRLFDHMVALQDVALATIRPGIPCAEVDRAVRSYYEVHDLMPCWKHHTGHAIGLRYHEAPYLDLKERKSCSDIAKLVAFPGE